MDPSVAVLECRVAVILIPALATKALIIISLLISTAPLQQKSKEQHLAFLLKNDSLYVK